MNPTEFSKIAKISMNVVMRLIRDGLIPGTFNTNNSRFIPDDFFDNYTIRRATEETGHPVVVEDKKTGERLQSKNIGVSAPTANKIDFTDEDIKKKVIKIFGGSQVNRLKELGSEIYKEIYFSKTIEDKRKAMELAIKFEKIVIAAIMDGDDSVTKQERADNLIAIIKKQISDRKKDSESKI